MKTRMAMGLVAVALAVTSCSEEKVTDRPGRLHPDPSGHDDDPFGPPREGTIARPIPPGVGPITPDLIPPWEPEVPPEGPWPVQDVVRYGPGEGIPGRVTGVGVDDAQNVYVIDGSAVYAARAGNGSFVRTASGGQFDTGHVAFSVCGGDAGKVYVGYLTYEKEPEELTEEEKLLGDLDRFVLREDGTLELEFHHRLQNSHARWMDHTRSILSCARVVGGPNHGDLYVGSNHGVTIIRGDDYADHRHAVWRDENGSQAIGYVWATNTDVHGNLLFAGHWKLAAVPPADLSADLLDWIDHHKTPWLVDTHPAVWGPVQDPHEMHAIAGDIQAQRIYVGSWGKGLAAMNFAPRRWWNIEGTPDTHINGLELDPTDGKLWVATRSAGLWRWDPATEEWEQSPHVPSGTVHSIYLDTTVTPRALYAGTNTGLYVIRAP